MTARNPRWRCPLHGKLTTREPVDDDTCCCEPVSTQPMDSDTA